MLESYVEKWPTPRIENFRYMLHSGMMGWLTIMLNTSAWSEEQHAAAKQEIEIYKTQMRNEGKKEEFIERIAQGKLEKFYQDNVLLEQSFIKDASKTVTDLLKEAGGATITGFIRMQLGEGHHEPAMAEA